MSHQWTIALTLLLLLPLADASKLSAQVKGQIPGSGKEAEKRTEAYASQAGKKFDNAVSCLFFLALSPVIVSSHLPNAISTNHHRASQVDASRQKAADAERRAEELSKDSKAKFEKYRKETGQSVSEAIDKFDKTVEQKASEAKKGVSSWFGSSK